MVAGPVHVVELMGFEPMTPTLPVWCATNCAITPSKIYYNIKRYKISL